MKSYVSEIPRQELRRRCIILAGSAVLAAAVVGSMVTMARAANGEVQALRGTSSETKTLPRRAEDDLVYVGRGEPVQLGAGETVVDEAGLAEFEPLQGSAGWFIDRRNNRLGNCYRVSGTDWKVRNIRCVWKPLP